MINSPGRPVDVSSYDYTKVARNVYVASEEGAEYLVATDKADHAVTVHERYPGSATTHWIPIMVGDRDGDLFYASKRMLDAAAEVTRHYVELGDTVVVHCGSGVERGPLTVAWYMRKFQIADSINAAYDIIEGKRPQVMRRTHWLDTPTEA